MEVVAVQGLALNDYHMDLHSWVERLSNSFNGWEKSLENSGEYLSSNIVDYYGGE